MRDSPKGSAREAQKIVRQQERGRTREDRCKEEAKAAKKAEKSRQETYKELREM